MKMPVNIFPSVDLADENGLLAIGGNLEIPSLVLAYKQGIFPWPINDEYPLAWFSPNPRGILFYDNLHIGRTMQKALKKNPYEIRFNTNFEQVILACAKVPRKSQDTTWITQEVIYAYIDLFRAGLAYCVEAYDGDELVGGVYGVSIDGIITGESMFHFQPNASKICLIYLLEVLASKGITWFDTQMVTSVVESLGGTEISRDDFIKILDKRRRITRDDIFSDEV